MGERTQGPSRPGGSSVIGGVVPGRDGLVRYDAQREWPELPAEHRDVENAPRRVARAHARRPQGVGGRYMAPHRGGGGQGRGQTLPRRRSRRVVSAFAAGTIIDPLPAYSQHMSGMIWGLPSALHEATEINAESARYTNDNLADYMVAVNADVPSVEVIVPPERDERVSSVGVKGTGEIGIVGMDAPSPKPCSTPQARSRTPGARPTPATTKSCSCPGSASCSPGRPLARWSPVQAEDRLGLSGMGASRAD